MTKVLVDDTNLTNIANAIRGKAGGSTRYKPSEMATAITNIPSGGGSGATMIETSSVSATTLTFNNSSTYSHYAIFAVSNTGYSAQSQSYGIYSYARLDDNKFRALYYMSYGGAKFNFTMNNSEDEVKRSGNNFNINSTYSGLGLGLITNSSQVKYVGFFW